MTSNPIPVTLIGGYLGSGKTTLINHLLSQDHEQRIAVLVNDFGELAIDASLIETEKDNIVSLSGGCVCCSYGNDLSNALLDVIAMERTPDQIVIEASGVAMPGAIASSVSLLPQLFMHSIIVLANAELIQEQANNRYVGDTIERQLNSADLLVLNKIDLVDKQQRNQLEAWLKSTWPTAKVVFAEQATLPTSIVLDAETTRDETQLRQLGPHSETLSHASLFTTFKIDVPEQIDADTLAKLLASDEAQLLRAKGFVQDTDGSIKLIQVVGRRWTTSDATQNSIEMSGAGIVCIALKDSANSTDINALIHRA